MDIAKGFGYDFDPQQNVRRNSRRRTRPEVSNESDRLPRTKKRKVASRRKTIAKPRKNRPYKNVAEMSLECCTGNTCLLNHGRRVIAVIRSDFDSKLYEQQNTYLSSLIDVNPKDKRKCITYDIRDMSGLKKVKVCKKAFLKILGIGKKRIAVLLRKIQPYYGDVEEDKRRISRNGKRLPLVLKAEVVEHIRSYDREESHYAREKTRDRQFLAPNLSIAKIWRQFLQKKELEVGDDLPLSFSSFRKIFRTFKLSFRRPYIDTCGKCDSLLIIIKYTKDEEEKASAEKVKADHVKKADQHYDCIHFDLNVLPKKKNKENELAWTLPPVWSSDNS